MPPVFVEGSAIAITKHFLPPLLKIFQAHFKNPINIKISMQKYFFTYNF